MSEHSATVRWSRNKSDTFTEGNFTRTHVWEFDGGVSVPASSSPHVIPVPLSSTDGVDPEEAFIAALSSCHMMTFLAIVAKRKYCVESYEDCAQGLLGDNSQGRIMLTQVRLRPKVVFSGERIPDDEQLVKMHKLSHQNCFIANSVKTDVVIEISN
ncbi:OsmC family protein [Vibrio parahaemolyticus]|uniref:OsmC family protein n=1 Tax=Vibrio mediterranei TaxID=689 RepID=UPI0040698C36